MGSSLTTGNRLLGCPAPQLSTHSTGSFSWVVDMAFVLSGHTVCYSTSLGTTSASRMVGSKYSALMRKDTVRIEATSMPRENKTMTPSKVGL